MDIPKSLREEIKEIEQELDSDDDPNDIEAF